MEIFDYDIVGMFIRWSSTSWSF